jgi:hypothetical protein
LDYIRVFNEVEEHFGKDLAVLVNVFLTINMTLKPTMHHLTHKGSFTKEIIKIARETLWGQDEEMLTKAEDLLECLYDWDLCQNMGPSGLGGCTVRNIKEIYDERMEKKLQTPLDKS